MATELASKISKNKLKLNFDTCLYEEQIILLKSKLIIFNYKYLFLYEL